jgi:hypothetical protein
MLYIYLIYMPLYTCKCCHFQTKLKANYKRHLSTNKHSEVSRKLAEISPKLAEISPKTRNICKYCNTEFKHKSSLSKHIKYTCKKNKDEDLKELVRLLNEQNKLKEAELYEMKIQTEKLQKQIQSENIHKRVQTEKMQKQIDKLTNKLQIKQVNNNIQNNNTVNYNINLLNYDKTDYSHLTERDYVKCIKDCNHCVMTLINKVHFNNEKPENKNIYISNIKNGYCMVYKDQYWKLVDRKEQIDDLYEYNEVVLDTWYRDYKEKYPEIIDSFERYLKNKNDGEDLLNRVKEQILLMLYNNRMITN